jgi:CubicO group peptidase (beta-lactamase class C family)
MDLALLKYLNDGKVLFGLPSLSLHIIEKSRGSQTYDSSASPDLTDVVYKLGSLSKLVTAIAVLLLVEEQSLNFDDPVIEYLPGFTWQKSAHNTSIITIGDLLLHTANLPRGVFINKMPTKEDVFAMLAANRFSLDVAPKDNKVKYSNLGYVLLGWIIETVTSQTYESFVTQRIFTPLGMSSAGFGQPACLQTFSPPHQLTCFTPTNSSAFDCAPMALSMAPAAAADMHASATHLSRLVTCLISGGCWQNVRLLQPQSVDYILSQHRPEEGELSRGMGLLFVRAQIGQIVFEAAEHFGHSAVLYMVPERQFAIVAMTNRASAADDIFHMVNEVARYRLKRETDFNLTHVPSHMAKAIGAYYDADGAILNIEVDGESIRGSVNNEAWSLISAKGPNGLIIHGGMLSKYLITLKSQGDDIQSICAGPYQFFKQGKITKDHNKQQKNQYVGIYTSTRVGRIAVYERSNLLYIAFSPCKEALLHRVSEGRYIQGHGPFTAEHVYFEPLKNQLRLSDQIFHKTNEIY